MNPRFLHLFFSPDDVAGGGEADDKKAEQKKEPTQSDREKELLREVAKLRKERDTFEAEAKKFRTQATEAARSKIAADLVDERYAKFLPDIEFDDTGKPTDAAQKVLDDFRAEFPDFFKTSAGADGKKEEKKDQSKKPVLPAGGGTGTQAYWDDIKKNQPAVWREPDTQRRYAQYLETKK